MKQSYVILIKISSTAKSGNARCVCSTLFQSPSTYALFHIPPRQIHTIFFLQISCLIWCLYCFPPTIFFSFCYWMGKGVTSFQDTPVEPGGSVTRMFFILTWVNHFHKSSFRKGWTIILFFLFLFEPGLWPRKNWLRLMKTWHDGTECTKFTRMMHEVVRPESLLAEGKRGFFPGSCWQSMALLNPHPWANLGIINCATLATPLSLRSPPLPWRGRRKETTSSYSPKNSSKWLKKWTPPQSWSNSESLDSNGSLTGNKWSSESWKTLQDSSQ